MVIGCYGWNMGRRPIQKIGSTAEGRGPSAHQAAKPPAMFIVSLKPAGRVLGLLSGSLGIEWHVDELLRYRLRVVIVAARLQGFVVFIHSFRTITLGVVSVAAFDMGPGFNPCSLAADPVDRRLKIIQRQLPVLLFEINHAEVVVNPRVVAIKLQ